MTDRDRLVELLKDTLHEWECDVSIKTVTEIAEHLISNGVIVSPSKGCEYCKGRSYTKKPVTIITKYGKKTELTFDFCPKCGRLLKSIK